MSIPIGIDLGTTNCCVAYVQNSTVKIVTNFLGNRTTPSFISFRDGDVLAGNTAKRIHTTNVRNTIHDVKRIIGRKFNDPILQSHIKQWNFDVKNCNSKTKIGVRLDDRNYETLFPEELSAILLTYLKKCAEDCLKENVEDAVITVPAYFNNAQRQATKFAAEIAGLNVLRIVNEPAAAAISYSNSALQTKDNKLILVYDLGGGTFDVSIVEIIDGYLTVKAYGGSPCLGGEDFNKNLMKHLISLFEKKFNVNLSSYAKEMARLYHLCEQAKIDLSNCKVTEINMECFRNDLHFDVRITREKFEELNADLFESTLELTGKCLSDAKLQKHDIDEIVMVGGSTRIPKIKKNLEEYFTNAKIRKEENPDEAVATGAAILAAQIKGENNNNEIVLNDITPSTLGVKVSDEKLMHVLVPKGSKIPFSNVGTFETAFDNQEAFDIDIYEGEDTMVENNTLIYSFQLSNITASPKGITRCKVTFIVDMDGILSVSAREIGTTNEKEIVITHSGLSRSSIEKMKRDINRYCNFG